jgi:hypothetical protein
LWLATAIVPQQNNLGSPDTISLHLSGLWGRK